MTDREMCLANVTKRGFEVSEIGNTLQWTMANGKTCVMFYTENGEWIRTEWI